MKIEIIIEDEKDLGYILKNLNVSLINYAKNNTIALFDKSENVAGSLHVFPFSQITICK